MDFDGYVENVAARLASAGFEREEPPPGAALQARRRQVKLSRFGIVETVVGVSTPRSHAGPEDLRTFSAGVLRGALARKTVIPRGLGSSVVAYAALVVEHASPELVEAVAEEPPKHWAALEFPIVVELATQSIRYFEKTAFWGAAYYRTTRAEAEELLGFGASPASVS